MRFRPPFHSAPCFMAVALLILAASPGFSEEFLSGYDVEGKRLLFGYFFRGEDGRLKAFDRLNHREIATIYHELWHAWFVEVETKRKGPLYKALQEKAKKLHSAYPEVKRLEIHEEAAADFIDAVISTYLQMKRFLAAKTPERRGEIRDMARYMDMYRSLFRDNYTGYFTRNVELVDKNSPRIPAEDTGKKKTFNLEFKAKDLPTTTTIISIETMPSRRALRRFIAEARRENLPVKFLNEAVGKIKEVAFIRIEKPTYDLDAQVVWSPHPLDPKNMEMIQRIVFEGLLTEDPQAAFAENRFHPPPPRKKEPGKSDKKNLQNQP